MGRKALTKKRLLRPDKREAMMLQLVEFFKDNRLSENNMDDIASYLNRSKATIYKHFRSKEDIINAIIEMKITAISGFVVLLNDDSIDYFERYKKSFELLTEHIVDISTEFLSDLKTMYPPIYAKIEQLIELAVEQLSIYYKNGMKLGIFNQLNPKLLAYNDFLFFRSMTDPDFLSQHGLTMGEAFADFYDIRCKGLL